MILRNFLGSFTIYLFIKDPNVPIFIASKSLAVQFTQPKRIWPAKAFCVNVPKLAKKKQYQFVQLIIWGEKKTYFLISGFLMY